MNRWDTDPEMGCGLLILAGLAIIVIVTLVVML
jgi:hypothetical protein